MQQNKIVSQNQQQQWTEEILPQTSLFDLRLKEVWRYKDLLTMFVKRDFVANYKQTILGPIWFFAQPIFTTLTFIIIFGNLAKVQISASVPPAVFYLTGITLWNYFAECLNKTATVFKDNANIFGKVYFPRLIIPLSIVLSNLIRLGIQFLLFLIVWFWYLFFSNNPNYQLHPNSTLLLVPFLIILLGLLGLGSGMLISSLTTKYRDLIFLLTFGVQLLMYATPIIYPLETLSSKYKWLITANPLSAIIETFRYAFTGAGTFAINGLLYSTIATFIILAIGTIVFNKVQKSFMDTV